MKASTSEAVFGSFDGCTSLAGFLAAAILANAGSHTILVETAGLAIASAVGMAAGDFLSGKNIRLSLVMGLATLLGSLVPAVPVVAIHGAVGVLLGALLVVMLGAGIAEVRSRTGSGRLTGYTSTFLVLAAASGLAVAVSLLLGVAG